MHFNATFIENEYGKLHNFEIKCYITDLVIINFDLMVSIYVFYNIFSDAAKNTTCRFTKYNCK